MFVVAEILSLCWPWERVYLWKINREYVSVHERISVVNEIYFSKELPSNATDAHRHSGLFSGSFWETWSFKICLKALKAFELYDE